MFDFLTDLYSWITTLPARFIDLIFSPAADFIDTLSPLTSTPNSLFGSLSVDVLQLMTLMGFPQAFGIISVAYALRFTLQLIPFVRLGS